jgi:hypothetical protein
VSERTIIAFGGSAIAPVGAMGAEVHALHGRTRTPVHPAVASSALASLLHGGQQPVTAIAAFDRAVYLEHDGGVLALETDDGCHLPNGVVLARSRADRVLGARYRLARGTVGGGVIVIDDLRVRPVRWRRARPVLRPTDARTLAATVAASWAHLDACTGHVPPELAGPLQEVVAALRADDPAVAAQRARRTLLGRGPGLTPAGDDVLAGLVAGVRLLGPATAPATTRPLVAAVVRSGTAIAAAGTTSTTSLSATLLRHAVQGEIAVPAEHVLAALTGHGALTAALDRLLAIGSSSGRDLAVGLLTAAGLVLHAIDVPRREP